MFKNDRMMLVITGLILAIFAGSMVQYSDRILAMMSGEKIVVTQDDSYSVRAGSSQILDVLSNDAVKGPIVVLTRPSCGEIEMTSSNRISFTSDTACTGAVEFAYCVDSDGKCDPNAVKINVISVGFAQANTEQTQEPDAENPQPAPEQTAQIQPATAAAPDAQAPEIASFSVEMAPPALAAPSITELVSPGVAVASIRRATTELNSVSTTDENISTQNTASVTQSASVNPSTFAAPEIGDESNNISLGGTEHNVASPATAPGGLQAATVGDTNIVQLERGPVALDSLRLAQVAPVLQDSPHLATNPKRNGDAPIFVASAQTSSPTPDAQFSAGPSNEGPIALIALNATPTRDNAAGESLNIVLTEPGLQSFTAPSVAPRALAPASESPSTVSVLERAPNVEETLVAPVSLAISDNQPARLSNRNDGVSMQNPATMAAPSDIATSFAANVARSVASAPNLTAGPDQITQHDTVSTFISVSQQMAHPDPAPAITALEAPSALAFSRPALDLQDAAKPEIIDASLPVATENPVITAPAQNSACEIVLDASALNGATIALDISAACKPNQMVTIEHSGLAFSVATDTQGMASVLVPAMEAKAEILVRFEDQSTSSTTVNVRDMDSVLRAGVTWQATMDLDLNALEFGAVVGSEGNITPDSPRDYRTSRIKGGGYLLQLGDPTLIRGAQAEVYTLPITRNLQRGTIAMSVTIRDVAPVCGQTISAKTIRTRENRSAGIRNVRFSVPSCSTIVSGPIPLTGAIDDIRVAGR